MVTMPPLGHSKNPLPGSAGVYRCEHCGYGHVPGVSWCEPREPHGGFILHTRLPDGSVMTTPVGMKHTGI